MANPSYFHLDKRTARILPWLVAMSFFMEMLDATILNTALPAIAASLNENPLRMQSVVVAYMLTVALLIPASGWLADKFGTRKVFCAAIFLFTFGSLLCALSTTLPFLVLSRILQGIGGAIMVPVGRLSILRTTPRHNLVQVMSFITVPGLIGPLMGPTLGGFLVEYASWHWIFLINIPIGAIGIILTLLHMPDLLEGKPAPFDWEGFFMFGLSMVLISAAVGGAGELHMDKAYAGGLLCAGLVILYFYSRYAAKAPTPIFSLRLFQIPSFRIGILGNIFARFGIGALPFLTPLLLQVALGFPPFKAGMCMIPMALVSLAAKPLTSPVIKKFGYRSTLVGNTLLMGLLIMSFGFIDAGTPLWASLSLFAGLGAVNSLQFTAMNTLTLIDLPPKDAGSGNSMLSVVMQISMSFGVAFAATLLGFFTGPPGSPLIGAFHYTYICAGVAGVLAALIFTRIPGDAGSLVEDE